MLSKSSWKGFALPIEKKGAQQPATRVCGRGVLGTLKGKKIHGELERANTDGAYWEFILRPDRRKEASAASASHRGGARVSRFLGFHLTGG